MTTQEELMAALTMGMEEIELAADIPVTTTLMVPAAVETVLDGKGFSLYRGTDESGQFLDAMIYLQGRNTADEPQGVLTLTNIQIDGQTTGDSEGTPAIIDYGNLVLDEGAVVKSNYNAKNNGGGVQVYGELTVAENAQITGNFAHEFGGGVYLSGGAALYLYADVIKGNRVTEDTGLGAELYAADGSIIYYDPSVDLTQQGFYICSGAVLASMQPMALEDKEPEPHDGNKEIFIHVDEDSGYTDEQIKQLEQKLESAGITIINKKTDIDTTDLRDWYVYDHYDTDINCWGTEKDSSNVPVAWRAVYGNNPKRPYYPCSETWYDKIKDQNQKAYTIQNWMDLSTNYVYNGNNTLAQFKEHIYTRKQDGQPEMTFAGYGKEPYVDFAFYDPESDGEKVVDFDVDSSKVNTHTLIGTGFLVNTGIDNSNNLYGYLVYYDYLSQMPKPTGPVTGTTQALADVGSTSSSIEAPKAIKIYALNGVNVRRLHDSTGYKFPLMDSSHINLVGGIDLNNWNNEMSIQIIVSPQKITVRQQPKSSQNDISAAAPIIEYAIQQGDLGKNYSGFGPLVAYNSHDCYRASSFTFSNLRMYFTNPALEEKDMLNAIQEADFSQNETQKYFLNLFGISSTKYNSSADFGQYQEYLMMMQYEGIALITDKHTPFDSYLGNNNGGEKSNLLEIQQTGSDIGSLIDIDTLASRIIDYVSKKISTRWEYCEYSKTDDNGNPIGIQPAQPKQSVGNIWLKSVESGTQIRKPLVGNSFSDNGYDIQIMDDITQYFEGKDANNNPIGVTNVTYDILKPNSNNYVEIANIPINLVFTPETNPTPAPVTTLETNSVLDVASTSDIAVMLELDSTTDITVTQETDSTLNADAILETDSTLETESASETEVLPTLDGAVVDASYTFKIEKDRSLWPEGRYTIRQTITDGGNNQDSSIRGYAYFELQWNETSTPVIIPQNPVPTNPELVNSNSTSEVIESTPTPETIPEIEPPSEPVEIIQTPDPNDVIQPPSDGAPEPKTSDSGIPALPVSMGACTAFMLKIRLWLYEFELGITEEKKDEMLRALIGWAKGTTKPKIYMAIVASAVILTFYHLLRALSAKIRQMGEKLGR